MQKNQNYLSAVLIGIILFMGFSCDSSVEPVETRTNEYTIYGVIDLNKRLNYIRIKNVNTPLNPDSTQYFEGTVRLTDRTRGETITLIDSAIVYDGITTHNFYKPEPYLPSTDYLLQIFQDGEIITESSASTPALSEVRSQPVFPDCATSVNLNFEDVGEGELISLLIGFEIDNVRYYERIFLASQPDDGSPYGYTFTMQRILSNIRRLYGIPDEDGSLECYELSADSMYYSYTHYGPDFIQDTRLGEVEIAGDYKRFGAFYDSLIVVPIDTTNLSPDL